MFGVRLDVQEEKSLYPNAQGQLHAFCDVEILHKASRQPIVVVKKERKTRPGPYPTGLKRSSP